jgi:hypothetical protein
LRQTFAIVSVGAALFVASCDSGDDYLTVEEFVPKINDLDGKTVTVAGYLAECAGYECRLYADRAGKDRHDRWFAEMRRLKRWPEAAPPPTVGIGSNSWECQQNRTDECVFEFDRKAVSFNDNYVMITGRVWNRCRDEQGLPGCTDRSTDIWPTEIKRWNRRP